MVIAATAERRQATCQPLSEQYLMAAPPVENSKPAATIANRWRATLDTAAADDVFRGAATPSISYGAAMQPQATPERIVEADGRVHVGWFERPVSVLNLEEAPARHGLMRLRGGPLGGIERAWRRMRLKKWEYTSIVTPRHLFAAVVVDSGYVGAAFSYVVERATGKRHEWSTLVPMAVGVSVAASSIGGESVCRRRGWGGVRIASHPPSGTRTVEVELAAHGETRAMTAAPDLVASFTVHDDGMHPMPVAVVEESEPGCWLYTHKCYGLPAGGTLRAGDMVEEVDMGEAWAGIDYNVGFRPHETWWNWAAAAGRAADGTPVGFNLTAHRPWPGSGAEVPRKEEDAADCAIWIGNQLVKIRRAEFEYAASDLMAPWRVRDDAGLVDLRFEPLGDRREHTNLGLVVSRLNQLYGRFRGELRGRDGEHVTIDDVFGVTEQHFARW
jgi:uncharacterized protein DUF2804